MADFITKERIKSKSYLTKTALTYAHWLQINYILYFNIQTKTDIPKTSLAEVDVFLSEYSQDGYFNKHWRTDFKKIFCCSKKKS